MTFAHLISRSENATGGKNYIAGIESRNKNIEDIAKDAIIHAFTLKEFMESFAVCDERVSHYVDHLSMRNPDSPVERAMMLIDFSLTKQAIKPKCLSY